MKAGPPPALWAKRNSATTVPVRFEDDHIVMILGPIKAGVMRDLIPVFHRCPFVDCCMVDHVAPSPVHLIQSPRRAQFSQTFGRRPSASPVFLTKPSWDG